jgi:hypothetical protein
MKGPPFNGLRIRKWQLIVLGALIAVVATLVGEIETSGIDSRTLNDEVAIAGYRSTIDTLKDRYDYALEFRNLAMLLRNLWLLADDRSKSRMRLRYAMDISVGVKTLEDAIGKKTNPLDVQARILAANVASASNTMPTFAISGNVAWYRALHDYQERVASINSAIQAKEDDETNNDQEILRVKSYASLATILALLVAMAKDLLKDTSEKR